MSGTRKHGSVDEDTTKLKDLNWQLRVQAAGQGSAVGPMVRTWIAEKLGEAGAVRAVFVSQSKLCKTYRGPLSQIP